MPSSIYLKVAEAPQSDVGFGRARVDTETRLALKLDLGEIVEIIGKKSTAAKLFNMAKEDEGKGIIRLDGLMRRNLRLSIGDRVEIRRAEVFAAERVTIAPIMSGEHKISFGEGVENLIKRGLLKRPLMRGDVVIIPGIALMGGALPFIVINMRPKGIVQIVDDSVIEVLEETVQHALAEKMPDELPAYFMTDFARTIRCFLNTYDNILLDMPGDKGEKARRLAEAARKLADEAESEKLEE